MPEIRKDAHSGAILFYLTPEEQKTEDVIQENKALKERLDRLEELLLSNNANAPENVSKMAENVNEEPKTKKTRTKKSDATE